MIHAGVYAAVLHYLKAVATGRAAARPMAPRPSPG